MKERKKQENDTVVEVSKWFDNKVLKKAVTQIKNTLQYLSSQVELKISNDQLHYFDLRKAPVNRARKIILYNDETGMLPEEIRYKKFHMSTSVGAIHLFHAEDYQWICKYLVTPGEIDDYLSFREAFFVRQPIVNTLPEQYTLAHYLVGSLEDPITPHYIESLSRLNQNAEEFGLSFFINIFSKRLINVKESEGKDYYHVQKEIAKLMRHEMKEFKLRFLKAIEEIKKDEFSLPYRMYFNRTKCGFVIIPLQQSRKEHWQNVLVNLTEAHKYDSKADKCIGVVLFKTDIEDAHFEAYWAFVHYPWQVDEEWDEILKNNFPFRPVHSQKSFRYTFSD